MSRPLFEITKEMQALDDLIEEHAGDMDNPEVQQAVADALSCLQDELEDKVDNYTALIHILRARARARAEEAKRLADRVRIDQNVADRLVEALLGALQARGLAKVETQRYRVSVAKNGGKLPLLIDEPHLPPDYVLTVTQEVPNKDKIRADLKAGKEVPGARLGGRGVHLVIK